MIDYMAKSISYAEQNIESKNTLLKNHNRKDLRDVNHSLFTRMFRCINCGTYVSSRVVHFFRYDPIRIQCYDCQNKSREELDHYFGADQPNDIL